MKTILYALILVPTFSFSQIIFSYDASGNRTKAKINLESNNKNLPSINNLFDDDTVNLSCIVYPNPVSDLINISVISTQHVDLVRVVSLYDITGKLLQTKTFTSETTITISPYEKGIYFIRVVTGTE